MPKKLYDENKIYSEEEIKRQYRERREGGRREVGTQKWNSATQEVKWNTAKFISI